MRFIVDESSGPALARWLELQGHDVFSVFHQARGASDEAVLALSVAQARILITNDKDFGYLVFRQRLAHRGVILLRLTDERATSKIRVLKSVLDNYADRLVNQFVVVTEAGVRVVLRDGR